MKGGVTVVQIREKTADTADVRSEPLSPSSLANNFCAWFAPIQFLQIAKESKSLCEEYDVPLIINDRIDIALAIDADGVHLGQTDMPVCEAQKLLPPGKIIGISCNNVNHVKKAVEDGADYVGIGAVWATNTKQLTSPVLGVRAVGKLLTALDGTSVKSVVIGATQSDSLVLCQLNVAITRGYQVQ